MRLKPSSHGLLAEGLLERQGSLPALPRVSIDRQGFDRK